MNSFYVVGESNRNWKSRNIEN